MIWEIYLQDFTSVFTLAFFDDFFLAFSDGGDVGGSLSMSLASVGRESLGVDVSA